MAANERREGEGGEKSSEDNSDDDDDKTEKIDKIKPIPEQFQSCTKLEICNWLVVHPHILRLANQMFEMNKLDESSLDTSIVTLSFTSSSSGDSGGITITDVSIKSYDIIFIISESLNNVSFNV